MTSKLYVVIVETGEYSDRNDWIGGVFDNKETAQNMIVSKAAEARQARIDYDNWCKKRREICERITGQDGYWSYWKLPDDLQKSIQEEAGEPPSGQSGDSFYLVEVPFNQWGEFSYAGDGCLETRSYGEQHS